MRKTSIGNFCKYLLNILFLLNGCFSGTVYAQVGNGVDALAFGKVAQETMSSEPVVASKGMVVSASNLAAKIGSEVLKNGEMQLMQLWQLPMQWRLPILPLEI